MNMGPCVLASRQLGLTSPASDLTSVCIALTYPKESWFDPCAKRLAVHRPAQIVVLGAGLGAEQAFEWVIPMSP
jgi:hypothetical protein